MEGRSKIQRTNKFEVMALENHLGWPPGYQHRQAMMSIHSIAYSHNGFLQARGSDSGSRPFYHSVLRDNAKSR
jgi:hypothetical protein